MPNSAPIISPRITDAMKTELDRAARLTRRSRSFLMKQALDAYLPTVIGAAAPTDSGLSRLLAF